MMSKSKMSRIFFTLFLLLSLMISYGMIAGTSQAAVTTFSDVKASHWAKSAIYDMAEKGVVSGFPDGSFRPDDVVTADQFITMMIMAHTEIYPGNIRDWKRDWWDTLDYFNKASIAQLGFDFRSNKSGYWATPFINQGVSMGFLILNDNMFNGNYRVVLTREKAAGLLEKWLNYYESRESYHYLMLAKGGVKDYYAATKGLDFSILVVQIKGVMRGYTDQTFRPNRYVTRAEAIKMVQSLSDKTLRNPYKPDLTGTFNTSSRWKDGSERIVVFPTKEFLDATKVIEAAGSQTTGASRGDKMHYSFYKDKETMDAYVNGMQTVVDFAGNPIEMGFGIGELDNTYEFGVHINESFLAAHKQAYDSITNFLFGNQVSIFNEKLLAHSRKYKNVYPQKISAEEYYINSRSIRLSPILGSKSLYISVSEKR